jgi:hypothetical protein
MGGNRVAPQLLIPLVLAKEGSEMTLNKAFKGSTKLDFGHKL